MAGKYEFVVHFKINGKGDTYVTVRADDSGEAERIVKSKYSQPIEITSVRKR